VTPFLFGDLSFGPVGPSTSLIRVTRSANFKLTARKNAMTTFPHHGARTHEEGGEIERGESRAGSCSRPHRAQNGQGFGLGQAGSVSRLARPARQKLDELGPLTVGQLGATPVTDHGGLDRGARKRTRFHPRVAVAAFSAVDRCDARKGRKPLAVDLHGRARGVRDGRARRAATRRDPEQDQQHAGANGHRAERTR